MTKILVVDDDPSIRRMIVRILGSTHDVLSAETGREALELHKAHKPEIVVTDIIMPDMEGIETIVELRNIDPGLRIIAMSGAPPIGKRSLLDFAKSLGADAVLKKPFRAAELLALIET